MIEYVRYLLEFQANLMKDDTYDKEDTFQDMIDILSIIVVTKSLTQEKDEQAESLCSTFRKRLDGRMLKGI